MIRYILKMKIRRLFYFSLFLSGFLLIIYEIQINDILWKNVSIDELPKIIWWTPFSLRDDLEIITCGDIQCAITDNKKYFNTTQAFLFYASNFKPYDLPLPRTADHVWGIVHEESPKNLALILNDDALALFNFSSTFSRYSDVPLTLQYLPNLDLLTGFDYFIPTITKNSNLDNISPVLYIQSDCQTPLERDSYVKELMEYINVDSYGKCLNNKKLPEKFTENPLENLYEGDFMFFISQYKFVIAFENAICDDYITEKLWRPLIAGSVPIYLGSPSVQDWLPNGEKSAILAKNFASPKELAEYLHKLNNNKNLYENYLQHKLSDFFKNTNENLTSFFTKKKDNVDTNSFHDFECRICENLHYKFRKNSLERKEYNCPEPISPLTGKKNESNWWKDHWKDGGCHTKLVNEIINEQLNMTKDMYDKKVNMMIRENKC